MALRRPPLTQLVLAGLSAFILVASLLTLVVRGGGGGNAAAAKATPTPSASSAVSAAPTAATPAPPLAAAAQPHLLHALKVSAPVPTKISAAITTLLGNPSLGPGVTADVMDVLTGQPLYASGASTQIPPASTAKIATAIAALQVLGPVRTLSTTVVPGTAPGQIVIVGGGDSTLSGDSPDPVGTYPAAASLVSLAHATAKALAGKSVSVGYDASLYSGAPAAQGWKPSFFSAGNVAPVSALMVDEGRPALGRGAVARVADPALAAGQQFAALLTHDGVKVTGTVGPAAPATGAKPLARVSSAPIPALVERMLRISDNDLAESLARQVALKLGLPATFAGAAAGVSKAVAALGIDVSTLHMVDGSGLSASDTTESATLVALLQAAAAHPPLRTVLAGLPVAGFLGTLSTRFLTAATAAGVGTVRAKTGTLTHVSSLAGVVVDADGRQLAFAVVAGQVPSSSPLNAEAALDRVAAALAGCGCN